MLGLVCMWFCWCLLVVWVVDLVVVLTSGWVGLIDLVFCGCGLFRVVFIVEWAVVIVLRFDSLGLVGVYYVTFVMAGCCGY